DWPARRRLGGGFGYTDGIDVHGCTGWVIRNNLLLHFHTPDGTDNLWEPAILIWNHSAGTVVEGNTILDSDRAIAFGLIAQDTGHDHQGGLIRNNFISQSPGLFSAARREGADGQILVWDSPGTLV